MKKILLLLPFLLVASWYFLKTGGGNVSGSGAPPYLSEDLEPPASPYDWIKNWVRPNVPVKVGLQAGHWKSSEVPEELERLKENTGASAGGVDEWEVNLAIANETKVILEQQGVVVDILPATIPEGYWADVFVAIHADGSTDLSKSGFKVASPRRSFFSNTENLVTQIVNEYSVATKIENDPNITNDMTGYYAFAWWRYKHSVHPATASAIIETGFLTSANDRYIIVSNPQLAAKGIAQGIINYLKNEGLI